LVKGGKVDGSPEGANKLTKAFRRLQFGEGSRGCRDASGGKPERGQQKTFGRGKRRQQIKGG